MDDGDFLGNKDERDLIEKMYKLDEHILSNSFHLKSFHVIYFLEFFTCAEEALAQKTLGLQVDFLIFLAQEKDKFTISSIHVHCFINPEVGGALGKINHERSFFSVPLCLYLVYFIASLTSHSLHN